MSVSERATCDLMDALAWSSSRLFASLRLAPTDSGKVTVGYVREACPARTSSTSPTACTITFATSGWVDVFFE